jgi:menaquinone-dependent protoporphyrinogen oxidase
MAVGSKDQIMTILVGYASKYGATRQIAERVAGTLRKTGCDVHLEPIELVRDPGAYTAFVIGGATYLGSWRGEATEFVRHNRALLATKPVWLFCSGPLGTAIVDAQGRDIRDASEPREFTQLDALIAPRSMRVFFGTMIPDKLSFRDRLLRKVPPMHSIMPAGDFRDWPSIDTWAKGIASDLTPTTTAAPTTQTPA